MENAAGSLAVTSPALTAFLSENCTRQKSRYFPNFSRNLASSALAAVCIISDPSAFEIPAQFARGNRYRMIAEWPAAQPTTSHSEQSLNLQEKLCQAVDGDERRSAAREQSWDAFRDELLRPPTLTHQGPSKVRFNRQCVRRVAKALPKLALYAKHLAQQQLGVRAQGAGRA